MTWLSADEAVALLGTKLQTLYAYASRRLVRVRPHPEDPRRSLYRRDDIERLARRGSGRARRQEIAAEAMSWGSPVLPSAISTVRDGRLLYRGQDATALSETATLEEVAALLWAAPGARAPARGRRAARRPAARRSSLETALLALASAAATDLPAFGRTREAMIGDAGRVHRLVVEAMSGGAPAGALAIHRRLAEAWGCGTAAEGLRRALVLLADHELNASTFATRVTVSTGASLAAGLLSGMATLTGPLHGGAAAAARAFVAQAAKDGPEATVAGYLDQGRKIPAFGHPLYPQGDCRAAALLQAVPPPAAYERLRQAVEAMTGELPNIDFALAVLGARLRLPAEAAFTLFAVARSVGWLAHAMEQAEAGTLIRPRADYVGPLAAAAGGR